MFTIPRFSPAYKWPDPGTTRFMRNALPGDLCWGSFGTWIGGFTAVAVGSPMGVTESAIARWARRISLGVSESKSNKDAAWPRPGHTRAASVAAMKSEARDVSLLVP